VIEEFRQHAEHADGANFTKRFKNVPCMQSNIPTA